MPLHMDIYYYKNIVVGQHLSNDCCIVKKMKNPDDHLEVELVEIISSTPTIEKKISRRKWRSKKYWLTIAMNCIVLAIMLFCMIKIRPTIKIGFFCQDPKLSFPFPDETIKNWLIFTGSMFGPPSIIFLVELYIECKFNKKLFKYWKKWTSEYFVGILYHFVLMVIFKTAYPELRPHFFDTCEPDTGMTCVPGEYVKEYQCTNKNVSYASIFDVHRSFFSGHASFSVYGSLFCAWYVHRRFTSRTLNAVIQPLVIILIIMWGVICSTSRITDHRHHWWDVLFGVIFGIVNALYIIIGRCNSFNT